MGSFVAAGGRKSMRAGYYIHIEPGNSFLGGGIWRPQPEPLRAIRYEILDNAEDFKSIIKDKEFNKYYKMIEGDKLKLAPKGFDKNFKDIELLKYKSYAFGSQIEDSRILSEKFAEYSVNAFKELYKANRFLNSSMDKWL